MQLKSFGLGASAKPGRVAHVELLGTHERPKWRQLNSGLHITLPDIRPDIDFAPALKLHLA
jgi:hypothetical protein